MKLYVVWFADNTTNDVETVIRTSYEQATEIIADKAKALRKRLGTNLVESNSEIHKAYYRLITYGNDYFYGGINIVTCTDLLRKKST